MAETPLSPEIRQLSELLTTLTLEVRTCQARLYLLEEMVQQLGAALLHERDWLDPMGLVRVTAAYEQRWTPPTPETP